MHLKVRAMWLKYRNYITTFALGITAAIIACSVNSTGTSADNPTSMGGGDTIITCLATTSTTYKTTQPTTTTHVITTITLPETTTTSDTLASLENTTATSTIITTVSYTALEPMEIPLLPTYWKAYTDYRCLTNRSSTQFSLQQNSWTDSQGIRRCGDDVCIALGTFYTSGVGERFMITLSSGYEFAAIIADVKADAHTDATNRYNRRPDGSASVIEFIVDTSVLNTQVRRSGTIGTYENYSGDIVSIQKIE